MKKKNLEEIVLDESIDIPLQEVKSNFVNTESIEYKESKGRKLNNTEDEELISCLRKERVVVKYLPKTHGIWGDNKKHVLAGGMAENAVKTFVVPKLSSGQFVNILTDSEKAFLEKLMGLEHNALSIYKKVDNFWDDSNVEGINKVRLTKQPTYLDLSIPEDYIRYKILLANKNFIAPNLGTLQDYPKATYQFVLIAEGEENKIAKSKMSNTMKCYKEYGKIENDADKLRLIVELLTGRPLAANTQIDFLQTKVNDLIQSDSKTFLAIITDPLLDTKVLLKKSIEIGTVSKKGNFYYLRSDGTPLCEMNEEPTLNVAARFLNAPKHQDILFTLQAKLK